jgi:small ligand-binding sensory domain FIST
MLGITRASRLITQLSPITRASGNLLLEIAGEDALDVLSGAGQGLEGQPLIFVALASEAAARSSSSRSVEVLMRPIQGIDPARRGIMLSEEVKPGTYAAFAIRDAAAARSDMESTVRELERDSAGAMPRFAIYINCAGRGSGLYETPNVDTRLIRGRFGGIPIVGFQSAFELAPYADHLALHLYTGVLALFTSPS